MERGWTGGGGGEVISMGVCGGVTPRRKGLRVKGGQAQLRAPGTTVKG